MGKQHWTAEQNRNYNPCWVLRYNPTPEPIVNADGTTTISVNFPALHLTDWVAEPEKAALELAQTLNTHSDMLAALKALTSTDIPYEQALQMAHDAIAKAEAPVETDQQQVAA